MAINPELITTIRVDQLPDGTLNLTNKIPHTSGTVLEKASVQDLVDLVATAIGVSGGVGYIALSVTDGQQLPDVPELPSFFLCGAGTFLNINGYPDVICTENLNAIMSLTDHWELAVEIPINPLSGTVQSVTGSAVDNTDPLNPVINSTGGVTPTLQEVLDNNHDLVDGNNFQGTAAGLTNSGTDVNGLGFQASYNNTGNDVNSLGNSAALSNSGNDVNALGFEAGVDNLGNGNTFNNVNLFGASATADENGQTVLSKDGTIMARISTTDLTATHKYNLPDADGTLALTTDIPTLQDVTDEGNTTTNDVKVNSLGLYSNAAADYGYLSWEDDLGLSFKNHTTQEVFKVDKATSSLSFVNNDNFRAKFDGTLLTDNRAFLLPDADGTIALTSDIPTGSGGIPHATASGTDTYTATITGVTSYADGDAYLIRFTNGNTTNATLNINSLGDITLYRNNDGVLIGGDIINGGEMICVYNSTTNGFQCIGTAPNSLFSYVTNADSVTLTKGMPVYAFSGTGDRMTVKRANNSADATSAQTVGLVLSTSIAANQKGLIMMQGLLDGLSILPTSTWADGDPVYLGATAGTITKVKPYAPNHLVYLGVVTTASNGSAGRMYVRVQNGYELDEIHDVDLITNAPTNNQALIYESSTDLWKNKTIIEDSITNGVTTIAPSQNAVFDALALKAEAYSNYPFNTTTNYFGLFDIVPTISTSVVIGSTANNTNNAVAFNRFNVDKEITISDFAILHNGANDGASATVTLYIFDDSNAGLPGVKLHQETTATGILAVAQKYIAFTNNITLQKGNYWIALHFRGLNTAGSNPSFIGGLVNQPNVVTSIASYNINFRPLMTGATADLSNNPTITLGGFINFPQIFIKI